MERLAVFSINAFSKPRYTSVPYGAFTHENRKKYRKLIFNDSKTVFLVPRRKSFKYAVNNTATDLYKLVSCNDPPFEFAGTVLVLSYDASEKRIVGLNRSTIEYINKFMTFMNSMNFDEDDS
jgi:hypothetical protein